MSVVVSFQRPLPVQPHLAASEFLIVEQVPQTTPDALPMSVYVPEEYLPAARLGLFARFLSWVRR